MWAVQVFLVMVPGLLCSQWELPHVRMEPWPEQCQPEHELLSTFLLRSVGVVAKKKRKESWSSCFYIPSFDAGSEGLWSTDGSRNFTKAAAWSLSFLVRMYQVKPNGWAVCYGLLIEQHSVLVCIRNYLHKVVLVTI